MTIQIFTSVVNRPDFVSLQNKLFRKFLKNEYQFHVIDDSVDENLEREFVSICQDNNIKYYKKPNRKFKVNPGRACADAVQWTYDNIIKKDYSDSLVFFCDSDLFLIDEFDVEQYLSDCVIAGLPQYRGHVNYMWNGMMFFNMPKVMQIDPDIDFSDGEVDGELTDVGGQTYFYFKENNIKMKETDVQYPTHYDDIDLQKDSGGYDMELHLDGKFIHYRAATNWHSNWRDSKDPLIGKTKVFNQIIESILEN